MACPQAEWRIILASAGIADRRKSMREQVVRLTTDMDWSRLAETLRLRRLLPILGPRILELAEGHASADFSSRVDQAIEEGRRQGAFLQLISMRVMAALDDAGIRSTLLKGPSLGEAIYGDPGRRPSSDIDLLVAPDQLPAAVEVVRGLGYAAPVDHVERDGLPQLHFALIHEQRQLPPVELHWRVHWYERSFAHERLLPSAMNSQGAWRPSPADELASLLLFYARDGFTGLRLASDLGAWWDIFGAKLKPGALSELVLAYPAFERVLPAALRVAERTVGLPAQQVMGDALELNRRGRVALQLANPQPYTSESQLYADMGLIDGLLMPAGGFGAFVRRQLLLGAEGAQRRWEPKGRLGSSLGRGMRVLIRCGVLIRYGLALARLLVRLPGAKD